MSGRFSHIACAVILFLATLTACSDEQQVDFQKDSWQGNHKMALTLKAVPETWGGTRAVGVSVDEGNGAGYKVKDFVIFQFDQNGNRLVDPKYYEYNPGESGQTIPIVLPAEDNIEYTIVVLANTHNELADITFADATTLDMLMGKYQKFEKLEDSYKYNGTGYDLLMNGYTTINKNTSSLAVELYRNVAKFTLTITNPSNSGVILKTAQVKSVPTKIDYFYHLLEEKKTTALTAPYPAHNSFTTFDYPIDEFEVRPGDAEMKLTYYLPCHLMGINNNSTSEKTKGNYVPDYATFIEMYGVSVDGNTYTRYRFYLGDNWINDYNIKPNYHYQLPIKFSSIGDPQADTRVQHVRGIIEEPDANSYIVNPLPIKEQRMYKIPVVWRINTFWTKEEEANYIPSSTAYTIIGENEWAADIIWQSSDQQLIEFYDENGNITSDNGKSSPIYRGQKPLCFKPLKGAKGNVVVGVYRTDQANAYDPAKREYSWSWHLWITDYNPDECRNQNWDGRYRFMVTGGEVHHYDGNIWNGESSKYYNKWIMDRNLGAETSYDNSTNMVKKSFGLYYQFGKKDPASAFTIYRYNSISKNFEKTNYTLQKTATDISNFIKYPLSRGVTSTNGSYLINNNYYNIWDDPDWSKELQGGVTKKSFFDPCPPGWRLPESSILVNIKYCTLIPEISYKIYIDNIKDSENIAYIPCSGDFHGGFTREGGAFLFYATPYSKDYGRVTWLRGTIYSWDMSSGHEGKRECAHNVRPIQE